MLGKIRGFLLAFQHLNAGLNHAPSYDLEAVPWRGDPTTSVRDHFCSYPGSGPGSWAVDLQPFEGGAEGLKPLLLRWLFDEHLGVPRGQEPAIWQGKQENCVNELLSLLNELFGGQQPRVWKVDAQPTDGRFYELVWDGVLFEKEQQLFLLHLGMSD
jgi:hypothetical protein